MPKASILQARVPNPDSIIEGHAFGQAQVKAEGVEIPYDLRGGRGKKVPASDYMELSIPRKASRAQIHRMVDRWINDGRGRNPSGF